MCINVDYLLLLNDFFVNGLPKNDNSFKKTKSISKVDVVESEIANGRLSCEIRIEHPQFVLFENQFELRKTNSLIIDV